MRKSLIKFGEYCESVLKENDYKGGWEKCSENCLLNRLIQETYELHHAIQNNRYPARTHNNEIEIRRECADIANFAMMIFDTI